MGKGPIRRSQLIAPFSVGSLTVVRGGTSLICCGLDHWFKYENPEKDIFVDKQEFEIREWRLEKLLGVSKFMQPPDFRIIRGEGEQTNSFFTVPFLRFPTWHFCAFCKTITTVPLTKRERPTCQTCQAADKKQYLNQVPFVALCEDGHIQDFPWREWVHRKGKPDCFRRLRLTSSAGAALANYKVECDCGANRSLALITQMQPNGSTFVSSQLDASGDLFLCPGKRIWLGEGESEVCSRSIVGTPLSASNLHFAQTKSAIYLPIDDNNAPDDLIGLFLRPDIAAFANIVMASAENERELVAHLRGVKAREFQGFTDAQVIAAANKAKGTVSEPLNCDFEEDDEETAFRRAEYNVLCTPRKSDQFASREIAIAEYDQSLQNYFAKIVICDKLRETRALMGFARVYSENGQSLEHRKSMMWKKAPSSEESWLPAYVVYGEGIFFEFKESSIRKWEMHEGIKSRADRLDKRFKKVCNDMRITERTVSPRLVLLHTFAHLLIRRFTFECGYSSASLRERLFVSTCREAPMAGLLIYTASGDSEGSMGGLARLGKPGYLEPIILRALDDARWCSSDPVCMEIGQRGGQGPNSCNLAACHCCCLLPETSCEEFNRFLDRTAIVGNPDERNNYGFFETDD